MNRKIPVNPIFENEDAVILSRKIYYKSTGFLEKTERVLLKTQKGVDYFTHMYLPENQERLVNPDMKNISHNLSSQFRFYNDFEVKYFCVRIIRPNGHTFTPEVRYTPIRDSIRINNNSLIRIRMFFNFSPLKVGDELQYSYKISVLNTSSRIFFNDYYPIQDLEIKDDYILKYVPAFNFKNSLNHTFDSTEFILNKEIIRSYKIKTQNVLGYDYSNSFANIDAVSYYDINPVKSQKYFQNIYSSSLFRNVNRKTFKLLDPCFMEGKLAFNNTLLSYYSQITYINDRDLKKEGLSLNSDQNVAYRNFLKSINDSNYQNDYLKMIAIHEKFNSFKPLEFKNVYSRKEYFGLFQYDYLNKSIFRYDYDNEFYYDIFHHLDSTFYNYILTDKRLDKFDFNYAETRVNKRRIFGLKVDGVFHYLLPQNYYSKYNVDELPFYYENNYTVHLPVQVAEINNCDDFNRLVNPVLIKTPMSTSKENYRQIAGYININCEKKTFDFDGKISLSGQYSTLLRNYYSNGLIDPSISNLYGKKLSDNSPTPIISYPLLSSSKTFPFKTTYKANFEFNNLFIEKDSLIEISISNWINFIYPDTNFLNSKNRNFNFYADFLSNDKYKFQLRFSSPVDIVNINDFNFKIENQHANILCFMKKNDDGNYLFDINFEILNEEVKKENIEHFTEIANNLSKLTKMKLLVKKV